MAATYEATQLKAKDRVRRMIADVAAPFRFQNEEIDAELTRSGFEGDPEGETSQQLIPELTAAIALLESEPGTSGAETVIRQGSVSRTVKGGPGDLSGILASLRHRLNLALATQGGFGVGITVVQPDYPETRRNQGWAGFGLPSP